MFDADRPIVKSTQDRLNRSTFAKYLARCMLDHQDPQSLVIGLTGDWGVGKTSIINLVVEELQFAASNMPDEEKPIVLNFSPWSYSGQNQLIYSFFRRLSSALRSADYLENSGRIIHLLELYVSFFTHKPVPRSLRKKRSLLAKLTFQDREAVYGWESGRDLTLIKAELNELLRQQKHKIIIIIDNISRLYNDEIKQIFQIVKSMGDYANTVYLLAFDKKQVIRAINKIDHVGSEDFIEKVVQMPFDVPPILQQDLENIFIDRLNEMMPLVPEGSWNADDWATVYYTSLKLFFKNCRDITRYINTLNFSYPRLRDIVNPVDFFSLTAIEIFFPNVYAGIRDNKDLFTDLFDNVYALDEEQIKKDRVRCDEIIARAKQASHKSLLDLLMNLFPRLRRIYQPKRIFYHSDVIARKLRRICSPDLFDSYFRLSIQTGQILKSEFDTILNFATTTESFDQALTGLNQDGRIIKFLSLLDSHIIRTIPEDYIPHLVDALIDNGDLFPRGESGLLSLNTLMRIHRIIHRLLRRFEKAQDRFSIWQDAISKASKSLYIIVHELREQNREHNEESDTYLPLAFRDLTPEQLDALRQLTVSKIESWAQHGSLIDHPDLIAILYAWREWSHKEDYKHFIENMTNTDHGLVAFLVAALDKAIAEAMVHYEKNPLWEKYLDDINAFISVKTIEAHAKALFEDDYFEKLREREQLALMIFLDLINASTNKIIRKTTV